jgi:hypothetical protein
MRTLALTCGMRSRSSSSCVAGLFMALLACRPPDLTPRTIEPEQPSDGSTAERGAPRNPEDFGPPPRWVIDGGTIAGDSALPLELDRALREHGRMREDVQDHIVVDLNDDGRLDAVVGLPAPAISGAYDFLVLLSDNDAVRVHVLAELVDEAIFTVAVVPLVDGPTLIAVGPRLGSCERGPSWVFLLPTGALLEQVGRLAVEPYDCAVAKAEIVFLRGEDGRVSAVEQRHGELVTHYRWDAALGSFAVIDEP